MYDSFSQDTKNEISQSKYKQKCCRAAMLYGMIYGSSQYSEDRILLVTENPSVLLLYSKLIKELVGKLPYSDIELSDISDKDLIMRISESIRLEPSQSRHEIQRAVLLCEGCAWAFVKGVFLSCATITRPNNAYHLEFLLKDEGSAQQLVCLFEELGLFPKITERAENIYGVYFKDSEAIVDLLGHIGANRAAFEILNVKIYKDLRNNANRIANCELANIGKTVAAANEQIRAIEHIIEMGRADDLPDELRQTLDLRAAFPGASLIELAEMHTPPVTKSGVNHRLKRLIEFSKKL